MKQLIETAEDARFLASAGIEADGGTAPLRFTEAEWQYLAAQLRSDVAATMDELRRHERLYATLAEAYGRLEAECAAAHRRVRDLEAAGWWERLWMRVKVTI